MDFEEKQYLGYNKINLFIRLFIALGAFGSYFVSDSKDETANLFLFIGFGILLISVLSFFVLHLKTQIFGNVLELDGFWTTRKVKVDLNNIVKCETLKYSKILFNRPVYNLHVRGKIKYFTHGNWAVELTDKDGLRYRVGSQRFKELSKLINEKITN
jgi:hypothetical protein